MQNHGAGQEQRGHVLLIAGDTAARRRTVQVEPSANLAALSLVPVPVLLDTGAPADTTYLDGVRDQQALLMRLRTAAATPGPLLVYLSGRLTVDRRGHQLHLALAHTTASTIRYTALPWEWLGVELRHRPAGLTTVLVDLAADKAAWPRLQEPGALAAPPTAEVYGVVVPPAFPGSGGVSTYTRAWIEQLRLYPQRPANSRLHALSITSAALPPGTLTVPSSLEITGPAIAARAAAAQQQPAGPKTNVQRILSGDTEFIKDLQNRRRRAAPAPAAPPLAPRLATPAPAPAPVQQPSQTEQFQFPSPAPVPLFQASPQQPAVPSPAPAPQPPVPQQAQPPAPAQPAAPAPPAPRTAYDDAHHQQRAEPAADPVRSHPGRVTPSTPAPQQPVPEVWQPVVQPAQPPAPGPQNDPRPHIRALAEARRFPEAMQLAQLWEQQALHTHGVNSAEATQWTEIRADLAKMMGNWVLATQLWIAAGRTRLAHQSTDAPPVIAAAKSAHYCWTQIPDPRPAIECGPDLIALLRALPTLDRRHVSTAQQRLEFLHAAPGGR